MKIFYFGELIQSDAPEDACSSSAGVTDEETNFSGRSVSKDTVRTENSFSRGKNVLESTVFFGALDPDTNETKSETKNVQDVAQLTLNLAEQEPAEEPKKTGMESIGDILKDLDLNIDIYRPMQFSN